MTIAPNRHEVIIDDITEMSISDGLKEALINSGFTSRQQILSYTAAELASSLEIDQYIARLILEAAKR